MVGNCIGNTDAGVDSVIGGSEVDKVGGNRVVVVGLVGSSKEVDVEAVLASKV